MGRVFGLLYGIGVYALFLVTFVYAIAFVGDFGVPKTINSGQQGPIWTALLTNLILLSIFAVQHSVMARPAFKRVWTKIIPKSAERSTYILLTCLALIAIFAFWQPLTNQVWDASGSPLAMVLVGVFWAGWLIVLLSTFMIDHFDLFGLKQVYSNLRKVAFVPGGFKKMAFYRLVRHPIMTGFLIAFWATPIMTTGHLLFAIVTTLYIIIAVLRFEEKDLVNEIGADYLAYQQEVGPFLPGIGRRS